MTRQEFIEFLEDYHRIFFILFFCLIVIAGVLLMMVSFRIYPSFIKFQTKEEKQIDELVKAYQSGGEIKPSINPDSQMINEIAQLRVKPIIQNEFNLKYNIDTNMFQVTLAEGVSKEYVLEWLRTEGYEHIPQEKIVF